MAQSTALQFDEASLQKDLERYEEIIEAVSSQKKKKQGEKSLSELDKWYQNELPIKIASRNPPSITHKELSTLMKWKLSRGKFRPKLQSLVESNSEENVTASSKKAFSQTKDLKQAINDLTTLNGVGPATASAILAAGAPEVAPFMADEVVQATMGRVEYTLKAYLEYSDTMISLARKLNQGKLKGDSDLWTPHTLELAIWCSVQISKLQLNEEFKNKRKKYL